MTNEDINTLFKYAKEIGTFLESNNEESEYWSNMDDLLELLNALKVREETSAPQKKTTRSTGSKK